MYIETTLEKPTKITVKKILFTAIMILLLYYLPSTIYNRYFNTQLQPITIKTVDSNKVLDLPDGSKVYLAPTSTFIYTKEFPIDRRKTELRGSGSVEITEDVRPFKMKIKRVLFITNVGELSVKEKKAGAYQVKIKKGDFSIEEYNKEGKVENLYIVHAGDEISIEAFVEVKELIQH